MSAYEHPQLTENFLQKPSLVDEMMRFLIEVEKANKMDAGKEKADAKAEINFSADLTDDNYYVLNRMKRKSREKRNSKKPDVIGNLNQMTHMQQIEVSPEKREQARKERIRVANNFRRLGNYDYRKGSLDKAIDYFTRAIKFVSDSPVLYVNRAICFIKKRDFKLALNDLEYVILNLDPNCLRAWLCKAGTLKRLGDEKGFETSVILARRLNPSQRVYIDNFLFRMQSDF